MKAKKIAFLLCILLLAFFQGVVAAEKVQQTPEQAVKQFYAWYLEKQDAQAFPILDSKIHDYVCRNTVKKLTDDYKNNKLADVDYFTKVQDYDPQDWKSHTAIGQAAISNGVATVPVVFGSADKISILVYLEQKNKMWKVMKVESKAN